MFVVIFHLALAFFTCSLKRTLFGSFVLMRKCTEAMKQVRNICIRNSHSCICEICECTVHINVLFSQKHITWFALVYKNILFEKDAPLHCFTIGFCSLHILHICILPWVVLLHFFGQWKSTAFAHGKPRAKPEPCATWHSLVTCLRNMSRSVRQ